MATRSAVPSQTDGHGVTRLDHAVLPSASTVVAAVSGSAVDAGGMPVTVSPPSVGSDDLQVGKKLPADVAGPSSVTVRVLDAATTRAAGISGVVLALSRADKATTTGRVHLRLDYSSFANAYGGDYGNRLRLVALPACVLSTPSRPECQRQTDLGSINQLGAVSADVSVAGDDTVAGAAATAGSTPSVSSTAAAAPMMVALTAGSSSAGATFAATSMSPSYKWAAGTQSGSFDFTYPMDVPPSLGGPKPDLTLGYDSGAVDAQTLAQNGQTSWAGEGWDLQVGYVERSYRSCNLDGGTTGDLCWFSSYNATLVFQGRSSMLVRDNTSGVWHAQDDSGLKIEQVYGSAAGAPGDNGSYNKEYWRVTTQDGTQYYFGVDKRYAGDPGSTSSVLTEPVYGNNPGEPCYNATFANASCQQGYRWNLDYVVDPRGNSMTYYYTKFSGYYGHNNNNGVAPYDLAGTLDHIDYGTRSGSEGSGNAPMQVWFTKNGRCINTCQQNTSDYPDTPWDLYCSSTTSCPSLLNPVFFNPYKLSTVYTEVWNPATAAYRKVDQWDLAYTYPSSGDNISPAGDDTSPNLWLQTVTHTGYDSSAASLAEPAVTFGGTAMFNRVNWGNSIGVAPYTHYRLTSISNGTGGQTLVAYSGTDCVTYPSFPVADSNPYRCFPQYFQPQQAPAGWDWFNKYVVTSVTDQDLTGGSPDEVTSYTYSTANSSDASLWHHDYNETTTLAYRSWSQWQGYSTVTVTHGAAGGPQAVTTNRYFRGMDGDGKMSGDAQSIVWGGRRAGVTAPVDVPGLSASISGSGGKCLDIYGASTANGTNIQFFDCTGNWNQVWQPQSNGSLKNPTSGRCLDLYGAGTANGTTVELWDCNGGANQVWQRQPDGSLKNPVSGRCLDLTAGNLASQTNAELWDCNGGWNQVWMPQNTGALTIPQTRRCIGIHQANYANSTPIEDALCQPNHPEQVWMLQTNGTLVNPASGKCMDITGGGTANGTGIQLWDCTAAGNQVWKAQPDGSLKNPASGRCLDATGLPLAGVQLQINDCSGALNQQWVTNLTDSDGTQGSQREEDTYDGGTLLESTVHTPTVTQTAIRSTPVTGGQDITAHMVNDTEDQTRTWIAATGTWRWTDKQTTYNSYGLPTQVNDYGDTATSSDDTCTTTSYTTPDTNRWLIDFPARVIRTDCAATPGDADYVSGTQTYYDGSATVGATPTQGLETKKEDLASVVSGAQTWKQHDRTDYDANGRDIATYDGDDNETATAYTPASGGPVTSTTETNANHWSSTKTYDPGRDTVLSYSDVNGKVTTAQFDPLGRLVKVFAPHTPAVTTPDLQYTYALSNTAPNYIETQKLGPTGVQIASFAIFDGQFRLRQNQDPTPVANGGRWITDTTYDSRGLKSHSSQFYNNAAAPGGTLGTFSDSAVPSQHQYAFDALERQTSDVFWSNGVQQWQTTHTYDGDREAEIPPAGGVVMQKIFDARGNTTQLRQFASSDLGGSYQATNYTYDLDNALTKTVDSVGNTWTWTHDLRGRETSRTDPDSGTTSTTYDDANNVLTTTDNKGQVLVYTYDALNRKTGQWLTSTTAPGYQLAYWTYDTIAKGRLTSSTRWRNADKYTVAVTGYDDAYRSLGEAVTLPAATGTALATTWTTGTTYNADGSVATTAYPAVGGLGAETVTNTYDANGFQLSAAGLDTYVAGTTYQPWGDVYQRTLGADNQRVQVTTDEYADTHRPSTITTATEHAGTPGTFDEQFSQRYNWTPGGTVSSIDTVHAGATTDSQCFSYDYLQRLTTAFTTTPALGGCAATPSASTVGGPDAYWQTYTYDATGGRTGLVQHGLSGAADTSTTYTYPAAGATRAHTLTSTTTTGPGAGSSSYIYDADGNQSNATVNGLSTDTSFWETNRVKTTTVHAVGGDQTTTYTYDADDNELLRIGPSATTLYLGDTEITTDAGGAAVTSATRYYTVGDTVVASRTAPGTLSWLAYDDQNTADVAVDQTTLAVTVRKQDPFGNARGATTTWANSRGFVGGTSEPGGLEHLGARLYDPSTGRFICDDPVTDTDNPQQLNGYAYAYNSPLTYTDPTGKWGWHSFMNVVQTVGAVATVLSFVPVIGEIAAPIAFVCSAISLGNDIYNWATGHGSWTDTLLDVASVATFGVGKALKYAKPLLKVRAYGRAAKLAPKGVRGLGRINKRIRANQLKQFGRTFNRWSRRNKRAGRGADLGGIYHTTCSWFVHGKSQHRYCH